MKNFILMMLLFVAICQATAQQPLNIITFNLRLNTPSDSANAWPYRKDFVASQILFHEAQIIGVQEAQYNQLVDLKEKLTGFDYTGGGRDDGKTQGEASSIFYQKNRLQLLTTGTFWLSQTPNEPGSKGWDADYPRIVTWAKFKDKFSQKIFFAFNTHFDHIGKVARRESAKMLLHAVDSIAGKIPAIITGDFNASYADEPIQIITDSANTSHLTDTKSISLTPHYGPSGTFNAFGPKEESDLAIDHIFVKGKFEVLKHATLSQSWQGRFASDHFAVFVRLVVL